MNRTARIILGSSVAAAGFAAITTIVSANTSVITNNVSTSTDGGGSSEVHISNQVNSSSSNIQSYSSTGTTHVIVNGKEVCNGTGDCHYDDGNNKVNISNGGGSSNVTPQPTQDNPVSINDNSDAKARGDAIRKKVTDKIQKQKDKIQKKVDKLKADNKTKKASIFESIQTQLQHIIDRLKAML